MPVTVATTNVPVFTDRVDTLSWVEDAARAARNMGASIILFPELLFPGYHAIEIAPTLKDIDAFHRHAEPLDGATVTAMATLAHQVGVDLVFGFLERHNDAFYNTVAWVSAGAVIGIYRKNHLYAFEARYMQAGHGWSIVKTPWGSVGLLIGHDKEFPEAGRTLRLAGADWFLIPAAWAAGQHETLSDDQGVFRSYDIVRAIENNAWLVTANYAGMWQGLPYLGKAAIVSPSGHVEAQLDDGPGWTVSQVDPTLGGPSYAAIDVTSERRTELYDPSRVEIYTRPE